MTLENSGAWSPAANALLGGSGPAAEAKINFVVNWFDVSRGLER